MFRLMDSENSRKRPCEVPYNEPKLNRQSRGKLGVIGEDIGQKI
jgi:hypothetical protein